MARASHDDRELLRIGDLAARTGVGPRLLRYYENRGLLTAERSPSGQRLFSPAAIGQVRNIRLLLRAGLPTRTIGELIGCVHDPGLLEPCALPAVVEHLKVHDERIADLLRTRAALQGLIDSSTGARTTARGWQEARHGTPSGPSGFDAAMPTGARA